MIIGIISDTHDQLDNLRNALKIFEEKNVGHIIHAGDFCSPFTWRVIRNFKGDFTGIFGNNDGERVLLKKLYQDRIYTQPYKFILHDRKIVIMHEPDVADELAESGRFDLVVFGHTHEPVIKKVKDTLIVNPGEVCGWLYGKPTAAVVNLETMEAEIVAII
ncbi:MAG: YfcE family phosphodiesterase [Nitrospirae bacterium GWC2_46_6]|nr:MAG: YfcE family phosphodiesterase [Nitrospirae bacterium GWC2_46_6]OGW22073.1 MAG: YfcE family phosphodiesterase [Nitrospirae bacterium GWA2_46_11]OGW24938.1 MAG: YfcE family phosphodiesterase [Nitrospirae bacterium GWB2_47_37]HAK88242.1 YfcE family phosphodiesterase [Nitrospiraceae bacterium]HCZ12231.1 YfcE family phosphodiesterase [Nitrospiraceae bacterium]